MELCNEIVIRGLLERHGFRFSRSMGQNFLIDPSIPAAIAEASGADEGCGVVFVSSDLNEVLEVADTVQVMRRGRTVRRWENRDLTAQQVLSCCYEDEEAET